MPGFDFNLSLSFLGGLLGSIGTLISNIANFLWNTLRAVYDFLVSWLVVVAQFLLRMLGHIGKLFRNIWDNWIKRGIVKLVELYAKLRVKLQRILGPVLRWVKKIRDWLDKYYFPQLKRTIQLLQRLRQILTIFRVFNIKWAKALDARLSEAERKTIQAMQAVRGRLNQAINYLNLILDPSLLLANIPALRQIMRGLGNLAQGLTGNDWSDILGVNITGLQIGSDRLSPVSVVEDADDAAAGITNYLTETENMGESLYLDLEALNSS